MKPHAHSELIKAWADGAEVQFRTEYSEWIDIKYPTWDEFSIYRIKPEPQNPGRTLFCIIYNGKLDWSELDDTGRKYWQAVADEFINDMGVE